jgi:hypothetical protein
MLWFKLSNSLLTWPWRLLEPVMAWALPAGLLLFFYMCFGLLYIIECSWNEITLRFLIPSLLMFPMSITVCRLLLVRCSVRWWTWLIQELCLCTRWQNAICDIFVFNICLVIWLSIAVIECLPLDFSSICCRWILMRRQNMIWSKITRFCKMYSTSWKLRRY